MKQVYINMWLIAIFVGIMYLINHYKFEKQQKKINELIQFINEHFENHRKAIDEEGKKVNEIDNNLVKLSGLTKQNLENHRNAIEEINNKISNVNLNRIKDYQKLLEEKYRDHIKEVNEMMFGSPPLKNKLIIVRNIKEYDYSLYKKDMEVVSDYLEKGWNVLKVDHNQFTSEYLLGYPLQYKGGEEDE